MSSDEQQLPSPPAVATNTLSLMNLTLLDPPRWGWTAASGIADVLPSHERARRKRARTSYFADKRQRERDPTRTQLQGLNLANRGTVIASAEDAIDSGEHGSGDHASMPTEMSHAEQSLEAAAARLDDETTTNLTNSSVARLPTDDDSMADSSRLSGDISSGRKRRDFEQTETQQNGASSFKNSMSEMSERSDKSSGNQKVLRPSALSDTGVLDMFTYHRGREGQEPRDSKSGELLCDVEPTDTNYGLTEPKLKINISIEFPLQDADENTKEAESTHQPSNEAQAYYKDSVEWDLSNSSTLSPMEYSLKIADEFGLNFGQTVDLAVSIQNQIDDFLRGHITYSAPTTIRDPCGVEREPKKPAAFSLQLYGSVSGQQGYSGFPLSRKQRAISRSVFSSKALGNKPKPVPEDDSGVEVVRTVTPRINNFDLVIEEAYFEEAKQRAKAKAENFMVALAEKAGSEPVAVIKLLETGNCHICHKRYPNVAQFPCLISTHIYCAQHCKVKLGITITEGGDNPQHALALCPICTFSCNCLKCTRRLRAAAGELKTVREGRVVATDDAVLNSAGVGDQRTSLRTRSNVAETKRSNKTNRPAGRHGQGDHFARGVPKVPTFDFPREVCGGIDLDPGTPADYLTMHTSDGSFLQPPAGEDPPEVLDISSESSVQEDGNVDYCQQCRIPGNLLCCDFCPRAYHPKCLQPDIEVLTPWECPACVKEKGGLAEDLMTGQTSLEQICAAFAPYESREGLQVLSIIHEMVIKLIDYDFGETFREPVDLHIIGYKEMIKHPMDLGTIRDNLVNGTYQKRPSAAGPWDDIVLDVLKDIELVWHNCFTFNREGSAIYRMAEVLRRRSLKIRELSFDQLLTAKVKTGLAKYVSKCETERGKTARPAIVTNHASVQTRGNARYKITVKWQKGGISRPVAVLDPDSGYVVKIYSTMRAAGIAAAFLHNNLGHPCEWKSITDLSVKGIIHRSAADPNVRLFGYRWFLFDELRGRKVQFPEAKKKIIVEMVDETGSYLFQSIEDVLSYSGLPRNVPVNALRRDLLQLAPGHEYTSLAGRSFRVLVEGKPSVNAKGKPSLEAPEADVTLISSSCGQASESQGQEMSLLPKKAIIVKEDIVARRKLAGFESDQSAYLDWVCTMDSSPVNSSEERTEEHFREYYLDGDRNIDGIVWKSVKQSEPSEIVGEEPTETVECDSISMSDSQQARTDVQVNGSQPVENGDSMALSDATVDHPLGTSIEGANNASPAAAEDGEQRPMNGFHNENQTNLHFLAEITELEESFPSSLSKVDNMGALPSTTPGKLGNFENFATELLTCQTVQIACPNDSSDVQTILKPFRQ